jgi:hypothetical protein
MNSIHTANSGARARSRRGQIRGLQPAGVGCHRSRRKVARFRDPSSASRRRSISATSRRGAGFPPRGRGQSGRRGYWPAGLRHPAQPQLHPTRQCIGRSIWRQLKPRGKRGSASPSCATCSRPVREPKMFSSSYAPVTGASSPGWSTVSMASPMPRKRAFCMPVQRHAGIKRRPPTGQGSRMPACRNSGSTVRSNSRITGPIRRRSTSHCRAAGSQTPPALRISSSYCCGHRTITQPTPRVPNMTGPMLGGTSTSA